MTLAIAQRCLKQESPLIRRQQPQGGLTWGAEPASPARQGKPAGLVAEASGPFQRHLPTYKAPHAFFASSRLQRLHPE